MADWAYWFAAAGALVAVEIFTGTFYLLMLALGFAAGGLIALTGLGLAFQLIAGGIVGACATLLLNKSRFGAKNRHHPAHDSNVNLDIGKTLTVNEWQSVPGAPDQARVSYRGAMWDVELKTGEQAKAGTFVIREIRANRLIVENAAE
ncbi:NfeD family protein [Oxalobacter vibrioformis]|uniref:NfeD family protein n=1 Tax=Oxalobacter vibrioformis TaxID=933080 RepID=A0A9E9LWH1_9BURK|nr:NfeD family protein [Oxalobacter vibrioformis]WAW10521.1 NfeD family protein [Oxalobacter vibrioformis]